MYFDTVDIEGYFIRIVFFFFQAEDGIRDADVTGVQTCALPISAVVSLLPSRHFLISLRSDIMRALASCISGSKNSKKALFFSLMSENSVKSGSGALTTGVMVSLGSESQPTKETSKIKKNTLLTNTIFNISSSKFRMYLWMIQQNSIE